VNGESGKNGINQSNIIMQKQYIKLKYVVSRQGFEGALEDCLDTSQIEAWRKGENKYVGFYNAVIEYILDYSYFKEPVEEEYGYYKGFLYTSEEVQKVREFGKYIYDWHCQLHPKAKEYQQKHRNYDYIYLTDTSFKQVCIRAKELYDYLKINDEKYDYERSLNTYPKDESWYDYECETIKKHDYERFFNVTLHDNHELKTPENVTTKPQKSLFEKAKFFIKNLLEQSK